MRAAHVRFWGQSDVTIVVALRSSSCVSMRDATYVARRTMRITDNGCTLLPKMPRNRFAVAAGSWSPCEVRMTRPSPIASAALVAAIPVSVSRRDRRGLASARRSA